MAKEEMLEMDGTVQEVLPERVRRAEVLATKAAAL